MSTAPNGEQKKPEEIEIAPDPVVDEGQQSFDLPAETAPEPNADVDAKKPEPTRVHMSPQDQARLEIAGRFRKQREDPNDVEHTGDFTDPSQTYGSVAVQQPDEPAERAQAPEPAAPPAQEPRKIKLKVRGQEIEVTEDEVIADAQKYRAADQYLEEAKRIHEGARRATSSRPHQDEIQPASAAQDGNDDFDEPSRQHPDAESDPFEELVEKVQYGDKKEAAEALRNTLTQMSSQAIQQTAWETKINEDLVRDTQSYKAFVERNKELAQDDVAVTVIKKNFLDGYREDLRKIGVPEDRIPKDEETLARHHRIYKLRGQPVRTVETLLEAAKGKFVEWKGGSPAPRQQQQQQQPNGNRPAVNVNRTGRREAIPQQPSRAAVPPQMQRQQGNQAPSDRSDIVARMRASRGQV